MAFIKSHLIDAIAEQNGFTKIKSSETVETILITYKKKKRHLNIFLNEFLPFLYRFEIRMFSL